MSLLLETGLAQLNKHGEELCGDAVETAGTDGSHVVVLADGLGSGVKANILSGLTSRMAATMLVGGCTIDEVIETMAQTLPVCEVRGLAYSTFSIVQVLADGRVYMAEYDNPPAYVISGREEMQVERSPREVAGRTIRESFFTMKDGDWVVLISDGVLHAGIGGVWNLGWGHERIAEYTKGLVRASATAQEVADGLCGVCSRLYNGSPGDDVTVVVLHQRLRRSLTLMVGPPADTRQDGEVVSRLLKASGLKGVCGGTTGNIVARHLGTPVTVDLSSMDPSVPPVGGLPGVDLVTEGMLTLTNTLEKLKARPKEAQLKWRRDGVSLLTRTLLDIDDVNFLVGRAINPAHQSPDMPVSLALKQRVVEEMARVLGDMGKKVKVEYF